MNKVSDNKFLNVLLNGGLKSLKFVAVETLDPELFGISEQLDAYIKNHSTTKEKGEE